MSMMKMLLKLFLVLLILTLVNCGRRRRRTPTPTKPPAKPPGYDVTIGACRGGAAPQNNAGQRQYSNVSPQQCLDRCNSDASCVGYTIPASVATESYHWCNTYTSVGARGDGRTDFKCYMKKTSAKKPLCPEFTPGRDGTGGTEKEIGEYDANECISKCRAHGANGITMENTAAVVSKCFCERGMTGMKSSSKFKSCFIGPKVCGRRGKNIKRIAEAATNHVVNSNHVINGNLAAPGDWPWAASLQFKNQFVRGRHFCGATLIDTKWAVTAAQCLTMYEEQKKFGNFTLVAGISKLSNAKAQSQTFGFEKVIIHPDFSSDNVDLKSDIALIKLNKDVRLSPMLSIACMPDEQVAPSPGESCYFLGWGSSQYPKPSTDDLQQAKVPILASSKCTPDTETQPREAICAGYETRGASACQFDAGGPLLCERSGRWVIHGVVSFSMKHCDSYTGFTPVNKYRMWIEDTMRKN